VEDGLKGISIACTFRGVYPDDKAYWPFYETANELNVPIFVHAAACPVDAPILDQYNLGHSLGRGLDLTLVTVRVLYGGVLEDFPNVRFLMDIWAACSMGCSTADADIPSRPKTTFRREITARSCSASGSTRRRRFGTARRRSNMRSRRWASTACAWERLPHRAARNRNSPFARSAGLARAPARRPAEILHDNAAALFKLDDVITLAGDDELVLFSETLDASGYAIAGLEVDRRLRPRPN